MYDTCRREHEIRAVRIEACQIGEESTAQIVGEGKSQEETIEFAAVKRPNSIRRTATKTEKAGHGRRNEGYAMETLGLQTDFEGVVHWQGKVLAEFLAS